MRKGSFLIVLIFTFGVILTGCKKDDKEVVETGVDLAPKKSGLSVSTVGYIDLEGGKVYKYSEITDVVKPFIDVIYFNDKFWGNDDKIGSLSPSSLYGDGTDTDFKETSITTSQFDFATKDGLLNGYEATEPAVTAVKDKVIFFKTKGGKKGLIKVTSFVTGTSVSFDLLITK